MKVFILLCAFILFTGGVRADEKDNENVTEHSAEAGIKAEMVLAGDDLKAEKQKSKKETIKHFSSESQPHTIADFIIHPLIALKARKPPATDENAKQAAGSSTPSPWQLFGFNPAQGLGSSVSSLAGTVTGWLGNRIQLPNLVETPVRESPAISSTTTTIRPNVIVRIQPRPVIRRPLATISNKNQSPLRRYNRPNRFNAINYFDDSLENDDFMEYNDYDDFAVRRQNPLRYQDYEDYDEEQNGHFEQHDNEADIEQEEDENERTIKTQHQNYYNLRGQLKRHQQRKHTVPQSESAEDEQYEDDDRDSYLSAIPHVKRFQNHQVDIIHHGQQNLLQAATAVASNSNKAHKVKKIQQQRPLLINGNGQVLYVAPVNKPFTGHYPVIVPLRRKSQPTQYITIPWSKLAVSNPNQFAAPAQSIRRHPLILTIPQSEIEKLKTVVNRRIKPSLDAEVTPAPATRVPATKPSVIIANKSKVGPVRLRPTNANEKPTPVPQNQEVVEQNNSAESSEDEGDAAQYIVIADEDGHKKMSRSAYRQILNYFNQNRLGRQLNSESVPSTPPMANERVKEQLIPVQVVSGAEEDKETKIKATTESSIVLESPEEQPVADGQAIENISVYPKP